MRPRLWLLPTFAVFALFSGCDEGPANPHAPVAEAPRDPYDPAPAASPAASKPRTGGAAAAAPAASASAAFDARLARIEAKLDETLKLLYDAAIAGDKRAQALSARLERLELKVDSAATAATDVEGQKALAERQAKLPAVSVAVLPETSLPPPKQAAPAWSEDQKKWIGKYEAKFGGDAKLTEGGQPSDLIGAKLPQTRFLSAAGGVLDINDYTKDKKKVVVVMLRGFAGSICLYCSAQTLALTRAEAEFKKRNAQVVLIYPGKAETVSMFLDAVTKLDPANPPTYPVGMDVDLSAVHLFRIRGELAKPTSIIVDENGIVQYGYAGANPTDRPSVKELLAELDKLK